MFRHWGLKKQFVTVFFVLITLPTMLFGTLIYYQTTKTFKEQAKENTISRLEKNEDIITSTIHDVENMSSFMIYDENFRTFFTTPEKDVHQSKYLQAISGIKGYFTFQLMSNSFVDSIRLKGKDGHILEFGNPVNKNEKETKLEQEAIEKEGSIKWSDSYEIQSDGYESKKVVTLTRVINDINDITKPIGIVQIRLDQSKLYKVIESNTQGQLGQYFVLSHTGKVLLHSQNKLLGKPYPDAGILKWATGNDKLVRNYKANHQDYLVVKKKIKGLNWQSVAIVNEGEVVKSLYNVRSLFVTMILVLIFLGFVAFLGYYYFFIKRIIELTGQTTQLEQGNFSAKVNVSSDDEIGMLGRRFNQMVVTIQNYINREYKLKIKQKESELKALQSQIDPHFLYNTLDMIRWTARLENAMETGQLIERLSKIFRMNLNMGKMWVHLEEEMLYIQNYLELQKSRMGARLNYSIYYDDAIKDAFVLKQILQPLVENSILHGFENLPRAGQIDIRAYQVDSEVWIDVMDNGRGFKESETSNTEGKSSGYALQNLKERLELAFGENRGVEYLDCNVGVWIRLKLPMVNEKMMDEKSGDSDDL